MKTVVIALAVMLALFLNGNVAFVNTETYNVVVATDGIGGQTKVACQKVTYYGLGYRTEVVNGSSPDLVGGGMLVRTVHNRVANVDPIGIGWGSYPRGNFNTSTWVTVACARGH